MQNSLNVLTIIARIDSSEYYEGSTYTVVTSPAPDQFSHPSRYKVRSQNPIGAIGQTLELTIRVNGIVRTESFRDKQTGQPRSIDKATVYLEFVSAQPVGADYSKASKAG
jgi:hypothetical protein